MKAITICQPYAHLIVTGAKRVENRTWPTRYRGPLLIHAGKSRDWLDVQYDDAGCEYDAAYNIHIDTMDFGAIVGRAVLADCVHRDTITADAMKGCGLAVRYPWLDKHEHAEGPWCWVLVDVLRLEQAVPWRGAQGLFDVPNEVVSL